MEPITVSIEDAINMSKLSKSSIYNRLRDGSIKGVRYGARTLVLYESLKNYLTNLPSFNEKGA